MTDLLDAGSQLHDPDPTTASAPWSSPFDGPDPDAAAPAPVALEQPLGRWSDPTPPHGIDHRWSSRELLVAVAILTLIIAMGAGLWFAATGGASPTGGCGGG